jgi:hemerythrin-like domain-containing protein
MINLENLNRQHETIKREINFIEKEIKKGSSSVNVAETALHISRLAGLLKIHLLEEDQFLYPGLLGCQDDEIENMASVYMNEMGNLASEYTEFKNKYNISSKIKGNVDIFISDAKRIMDVLNKRIQKEDSELYYLVKERKL